MPSKSRLRAEKTLTDGRQLRMIWDRTIYPATQDEPQDLDDGPQTFYLDGTQVEYDDIDLDEVDGDLDDLLAEMAECAQIIETYGDDYEC